LICLDNILVRLETLNDAISILLKSRFLFLSVHRFHELRARINGLVFYFSQSFPSPVEYLQNEERIIVDDVKEDEGVD